MACVIGCVNMAMVPWFHLQMLAYCLQTCQHLNTALAIHHSGKTVIAEGVSSPVSNIT